MTGNTDFSASARAYAREELGMGDDEPNGATGVETYTRYSLIAEAYDVGAQAGDYYEGIEEGHRLGRKEALIAAAEDAEKVARIATTPFNQLANDEHSFARYHDLWKLVPGTDVLVIANWLHGRAAHVGSAIPTATAAVGEGLGNKP